MGLWAKRLMVVSAVAVALAPLDAEAQRRRPPTEVVAWSADARVVVLAEARSPSRRDLVARLVPSGDVVAHRRVYPGRCARRISGQVAISHACAMAELRPRLPSRFRELRYHIAANERGRISSITLRADGSIVDHELPRLGLVLRGRTESDRRDRSMAVLEVGRLGREPGRVLDRRPLRPRARRRWTLLQAGDDKCIILGRGLLRRISRPTRDRRPARGDSERERPPSG